MRVELPKEKVFPMPFPPRVFPPRFSQPFGLGFRNCDKAVPSPYQLERKKRDWLQAKTQGIARKSERLR
jgi:hypothetical protein